METITKKVNGQDIEFNIEKMSFFDYKNKDTERNILFNGKEYFYIGEKDARCNFLEINEWTMLLIKDADIIYVIEKTTEQHLILSLLKRFPTEIKDKKKYKTYIMFDSPSGLYKIGKSTHVEIREKTLSGQIPLIKTILVCNDNVENNVHIDYSDKRVRGEWFRLDENDILDIINKFGFYKYNH